MVHSYISNIKNSKETVNISRSERLKSIRSFYGTFMTVSRRLCSLGTDWLSWVSDQVGTLRYNILIICILLRRKVPIAAITAQPSVIQNKKFYSWKLYEISCRRDARRSRSHLSNGWYVGVMRSSGASIRWYHDDLKQQWVVYSDREPPRKWKCHLSKLINLSNVRWYLTVSIHNRGEMKRLDTLYELLLRKEADKINVCKVTHSQRSRIFA